MSALGPPGGGRSEITARILRHFNIISYPELDQDTISVIFLQLTKSFFGKFSDDVKLMIPKLIETVLIIFDRAKKELLPTPKKSHYTFNLRDISKVFQGICNASLKHCNEPLIILRLWYHENMRIFHDRLIEDPDRDYLKQILSELIPKFGFTEEEVIANKRVVFGDFWHGRDVEPRVYIEIPDLQQLISKMNEYLEEFNNDPHFSGAGGKNQMKLVLFLDACEHIARISRILRQPKGNALLLGVGGSGRQSLSRLSTFMSGYKLFSIEVVKNYSIRIWRDDVKRVLMQAGVENSSVSFLFVDT